MQHGASPLLGSQPVASSVEADQIENPSMSKEGRRECQVLQ